MIKPSRVRFVGVIYIGKIRNECQLCSGKLKARDHAESAAVEGKTLSKYILQNELAGTG
jgi:hypothetical protein